MKVSTDVKSGKSMDGPGLAELPPSRRATCGSSTPGRSMDGRPRHNTGPTSGGLCSSPAPHQFGGAGGLLGRAAHAKIRVDHIYIGLMPAEFASALAMCVLESQAFLVAHDLMGCRLPDVNHGLARQVRRFDQLGLHETSPPKLRRRRR